MARPTKLTKQLITEIALCIEGGNFRDAAAAASSVPLRTFHRWCQLGRKFEGGLYAELWQAVLAAEALAETGAVTALRNSPDSEDLKWWLERKFPERWGRDKLRLNDLERRLKELEKLGGADSEAVPAPV